jgi:hypothetical protein
MIDGYNVNVGDTVFILGVGRGTVSSIADDGSFSVKIGRGVQHFSDGGMVGNTRRVYWHDPVLFNPPKDVNVWNTIKQAAFYIKNLIERLYGARVKVDVPEVNDETTE